MNKYIISWINLVFGAIAVLFLLLAVWFYFMRPSEITLPEEVIEKPKLPKGAFELEVEDYQAIGPPFIDLSYSPMELQLPNLSRYLIYYGKNERPDANVNQPTMHFSFLGSTDVISTEAGKPVYLIYDDSQSRGKYKFSPDNAETSLWIETEPSGKDATIKVAMKNEAGEIIRTPEANAAFTLKERPTPRTGNNGWKLGDFRVDGTLLARQKARWYGTDKFLEKHGGEEYKEFLDKQRVDFGTGEERYSAYIGPNGALAWINGEWKEVVPGEETLSYPLLVVNQMDERLMKLDLWDVGGERKVNLNLIKSSQTWLPQKYLNEFKFVAARTRSQYVFELQKQRITLSPQDWLLRTGDGWKKISTAQEIDDYVDRKIVGPLFVFDDVVKKDGKQAIVGTLFSESRTEMQPIELLMQQGATAEPLEKEKTSKPINRPFEPRLQDDEEDDDDEEEGTRVPVPPKISREMSEEMKERLKERLQKREARTSSDDE